MTNITTIATTAAAPMDRPRGGVAPTTLTPASFSDMYRSVVAASVDRDGGGVVSGKEYTAQTDASDSVHFDLQGFFV